MTRCAHGGRPDMCPKCYADGGEVDLPPMPKGDPRVVKSLGSAFGKAKGGMIEEEEESGYPDELIERIMQQHAMSKGGKVANDVEPIADSESAQYDLLPKEDDLEFSYTGENSGDEDGNAAVEDDEDELISRIMKSRALKDKMPRPA